MLIIEHIWKFKEGTSEMKAGIYFYGVFSSVETFKKRKSKWLREHNLNSIEFNVINTNYTPEQFKEYTEKYMKNI